MELICKCVFITYSQKKKYLRWKIVTAVNGVFFVCTQVPHFKINLFNFRLQALSSVSAQILKDSQVSSFLKQEISAVRR